MGLGSSYHEAYCLNATILLLGVGNNRNSMLHYCEVAADLPYLDIPFREFWGRTALVNDDGHVEQIPLPHEFCGCSAKFDVVDKYLDEENVLTHGRICDAPSLLMNAREMADTVIKRLRKNPAWLLCDSFICEPCTLRRRRLHERGML